MSQNSDILRKLGIVRFKSGQKPPQNSTDYSILGKLADENCSWCYGRGYEVVNGRRGECRCTTLYLKLTSEILDPVPAEPVKPIEEVLSGPTVEPSRIITP